MLRLMNEELHRLSTFADWPSDVCPLELARGGFFYTGSDDTVKCYRCLWTMRNWRHGDNPLDRHRITNPDCPLITGRDTLNAANHPDVPLNVLAQRPVSTLEPDRIRQIIPCINRSRPNERSFQHLRLSSYRLQTFHDWPKGHIVSAVSLACAGFFYTGYSDKVQCAFCRTKFVNWQAGDIPTEEHRREVYSCTFVGNNFCSPMQLPSPPSSRVVSGQQHQANEQAQRPRTLHEIRAENEILRSERQCDICMLNEHNRVLRPCGHLLCSDCLDRLRTQPRCHICRTPFADGDVSEAILPSISV